MCDVITNSSLSKTYKDSFIGFRDDRIAKLSAGFLSVAGNDPVQDCGELNKIDLPSWDLQICSEIPMPADGGGAAYQASYSWYDFWQSKYSDECSTKYGTVPDYTFPVD
jgi:hypothetical protein